MEKIRNLSIRKTIVLYMLINIVISFFLGMFVIHAAGETQKQIWWKYVDQESYNEARAPEKNVRIVEIPRANSVDMTKTDNIITEVCDFLTTYSILVFSVIGAIFAVILFYRDKIKVPLEELAAASRMIANKKLDFSIDYTNKDELGILCNEFERMRSELEINNREMWRMVEEEKALRSAIAHDIRSPLATLRGYQEMLLEFIPTETLDKEKMLEMLGEGMKQIERMNRFLETMLKLSSLEQRTIKYSEMDAAALGAMIDKNTQGICNDSAKEIQVNIKRFNGKMLIDKDMVLEVIENIVSNAHRYAHQKIDIDILVWNQELQIAVKDDGMGFEEAASEVTKAYFHSNPQDDLKHFGLGMYISRIYCEKHGGRLLIGNQVNGGAEVKAIFKIGIVKPG